MSKKFTFPIKFIAFCLHRFIFFPFLNQQTTDILWLILFCFLHYSTEVRQGAVFLRPEKKYKNVGIFAMFFEGLKYQEIQDCTDTDGCFKLQGSCIVKLRCFTIKKTRSIQVHSFIINKVVLELHCHGFGTSKSLVT